MKDSSRGRSRGWFLVAVTGIVVVLLLAALPGAVRPWSEIVESPYEPIEVRLVHPSLLQRWLCGRLQVSSETSRKPLCDTIEVVDVSCGERITAAAYPIRDTAEDGVWGIDAFWHPDGRRLVCVFRRVDFAGDPGSACFVIQRYPLVVAPVARGAWMLQAIPPDIREMRSVGL